MKRKGYNNGCMSADARCSIVANICFRSHQVLRAREVHSVSSCVMLHDWSLTGNLPLQGCNYTVHKGKCMEAASKFECYSVDGIVKPLAYVPPKALSTNVVVCGIALAQNRSRQESHLDTFHNQVAGHKGKAAFLKDLDGGKRLHDFRGSRLTNDWWIGKIFKPLCPVEFYFYSLLAKLACFDQHDGIESVILSTWISIIDDDAYSILTAPGIPREEFGKMKTFVKDPSAWYSFFPRFYGAAQTVQFLSRWFFSSVDLSFVTVWRRRLGRRALHCYGRFDSRLLLSLCLRFEDRCSRCLVPHRIVRICILMVEAGYDDRASTKKILQQKLLCSVTTSSTLCFRLCGMQVC